MKNGLSFIVTTKQRPISVRKLSRKRKYLKIHGYSDVKD